jgi:hypothetical protein
VDKSLTAWKIVLLEKLRVALLVKKFLDVMESKILLPSSQDEVILDITPSSQMKINRLSEKLIASIFRFE